MIVSKSISIPLYSAMLDKILQSEFGLSKSFYYHINCLILLCRVAHKVFDRLQGETANLSPIRFAYRDTVQRHSCFLCNQVKAREACCVMDVRIDRPSFHERRHRITNRFHFSTSNPEYRLRIARDAKTLTLRYHMLRKVPYHRERRPKPLGNTRLVNGAYPFLHYPAI